MAPVHDREKEAFKEPGENKPGVVAVEGGVVEEVPDRGVIDERGRGSTLDQGEVALIGRVMSETEEPVQKEMRIRLTQDQKELSDLGGDYEDEVMIRRERVPVPFQGPQNHQIGLLASQCTRAPLEIWIHARRAPAAPPRRSQSSSLKGSPARI